MDVLQGCHYNVWVWFRSLPFLCTCVPYLFATWCFGYVFGGCPSCAQHFWALPRPGMAVPCGFVRLEGSRIGFAVPQRDAPDYGPVVFQRYCFSDPWWIHQRFCRSCGVVLE
eukprot:jgi/Botrbrau1/15950/Bobra.0260s0011.1